MASEADLVLMDKERIVRSLNRMAHEIAEQNIDDQPIVLFGIDERGYVVSQELADILKPLFEGNVQAVQLQLEKGQEDNVFQQFSKSSVSNQFIVAVDDVIFSGETMFTALKTISDAIDPSEIYTAVLIDRGHRKFPIKAKFCGMELPTKLNEHVSVILDGEKTEKVILTSPKK